MPPDDPAAPGAAPAVPAEPAAPVVPDTGKSAPDPSPGISEKEMATLLDESTDNDEPAPAPAASPAAPAAAPAVPPVQQPSAAPASPPQVPPQQPPAAVVPPVVPPVVVPPVEPVAPAAPPVAPVTPAPVVPAPETVRAEQLARRNEYAKSLETLYALPEKDAIDFNANPGGNLPKMAAKLHLEVLESAVHGVMMQLPKVVEAFLVRRENTTKAENEFYSTWPMLDKNNPQHRQTVNSLVSAITQGNPNITRIEAIKQAGAASLVALGIPYDAPRAGAAPVAPVVPATAQPFAPALPGVGGQGVPGAAPGSNPFEALSREFEEDM